MRSQIAGAGLGRLLTALALLLWVLALLLLVGDVTLAACAAF